MVWFNDSMSTSPERTIAAVRSFDEPLVILLGGRDKNLSWEALAVLVHARARHTVLYGEAADLIGVAFEAAVAGAARQTQITRCGGLGEAIEAADRLAQAGDVIVLSPGCTSFDEFTDFAARGVTFKKLVNELPE